LAFILITTTDEALPKRLCGACKGPARFDPQG